MKLLNITLLAILTTSRIYAGGVFSEPIYETEDIEFADEAVVEEYPQEEEYIAPAPVEEYVAPPVEEEYVDEPIEEEVTPPPPPPPPPPPVVKNIKTNGLYAGIGISAAKFKTKCKSVGTAQCSNSTIDKTAGLMGRVGYDVNQYIGIEARGIRTNWKYDGGKVKHLGVFVKPMIPVGKQTNIYGLAGVAKTTTQGRWQHVDTKSFAWGGGIEYDVSTDRAKEGRYSREFDGHGDQEKGLGVFADYERLIQKSGSPDLDTINVGLTYDF